MKCYHYENERIKHVYFCFLKEAKQLAPITISAIRKAIHRLEEFSSFANFKSFNKKQAIAFKKHLQTVNAQRSKRPLTKPTLLNNINSLKLFLTWLQSQPSYRLDIKLSDIEYLNLSRKDIRAAKEPKYKPFPTLEQLETVMMQMPHKNEIEMRDQAMFSFIVLTGIRDGAVTSLKLKHVNLNKEHIFQDPDEVKTKFSKSINTYFFPVSNSFKIVFLEWVQFLKTEKLFGLEDPLFPKETLKHDKNGRFCSAGLSKQHWQKGDRTRKNFKDAFNNVGLDYFNPHRIRDTLAHLGQQVCNTPEEFKAWSQNLGHQSPLTTFISYGEISGDKQGHLLKTLKQKPEEKNDFQLILEKLNKIELKKDL